MRTVALAIAAATAATALVTAAPAVGAPTESAGLRCGSQTYTVTGWGRGTPLKLSSSNVNYIVMYARLEPSGKVVLDNLGHAGDPNLLTCTATSPSGQSYTFRGFFTGRS